MKVHISLNVLALRFDAGLSVRINIINCSEMGRLLYQHTFQYGEKYGVSVTTGGFSPLVPYHFTVTVSFASLFLKGTYSCVVGLNDHGS